MAFIQSVIDPMGAMTLGINDALNKGHLNVVLIDLVHRESSSLNANNVRIVTKDFGLNVHGGCIVASSSLKRKKAERSSTSHSVILGHWSVLGTGRPAPLPGMPSNRRSRQGHSVTRRENKHFVGQTKKVERLERRSHRGRAGRAGGGGRFAATITRLAAVITRRGSCVSGP